MTFKAVSNALTSYYLFQEVVRLESSPSGLKSGHSEYKVNSLNGGQHAGALFASMFCYKPGVASMILFDLATALLVTTVFLFYRGGGI